MKRIILLLLLASSLQSYSQEYTTLKIDSLFFKLPGPDWKLIGKNPEGGQFMFQNQTNKVTISLSARDKTQFDFYKSALSDMELVQTFYKWDAEYWASNKDYEVTEIKRDADKNYIIWELKSSKAENYSLYGLKSNYLVGLSVPRQKAIELKEQIELLEKIFLGD
jgi:hypothetical protein